MSLDDFLDLVWVVFFSYLVYLVFSNFVKLEKRIDELERKIKLLKSKDE